MFDTATAVRVCFFLPPPDWPRKIGVGLPPPDWPCRVNAGDKVPSAFASMADKLRVSMADVRANAAKTPKGAWMVVKGKVYDFTNFAPNHPGGAGLLLKNNGKDATAEFVASHPEDIIARTITPDQHQQMYIGPIDAATMTAADVAVYDPNAHEAAHAAAPVSAGGGTPSNGSTNVQPSLSTCLNLYDFEAIASRTIKKAGWAYYSSGADDEITLRENHSAFHRIWLRPRVMINVKHIDMSANILGFPSSMPLYYSAAAMCKLGHPDGECAWTRAAATEGVIQMIPTLSSCSLDEIMDARIEGQICFFQLYVNSNRDTCRAMVEKAERLGCNALFITCDAPQLGNREKDRRVKVSHSGAAVQSSSGSGGGGGAAKNEGTSKLLTTFIDPSLCWDDVAWFRSITKMKIVLKGLATAEDAVKAYEHGIDGIVVSNHGGRQLDFARSGIEILPEVMAALRERNIADKMEVYVDGGVRRGTDIFKALALGAKVGWCAVPVCVRACTCARRGASSSSSSCDSS
jgi:L-lactate dehydrogenase (cytochrome)